MKSAEKDKDKEMYDSGRRWRRRPYHVSLADIDSTSIMSLEEKEEDTVDGEKTG